MENARKVFFDDIFDIFSMLVGSNFVTLYDVKSRVTRYSEAIVKMLDLPGERIEDGMYDWMDYIHPEDRDLYDKTMKDMFALRSHTYDLTYRVKLSGGEYGMFRLVGGMIRDVDGHPSIAGGMMIPIGMTEHADRTTSMKNLHALLEDVVHTDMDVERLSLLLTGFGRLSRINEIYGYGYGSKLLIGAAEIIKSIVGEGYEIYRTAGSKFVILSKDNSYEQMNEIYDKLRERFRAGVEIDGIVHNLNMYGGYMNINDASQITDRSFYDCLLHAYTESKQYKHGELVVYNGNNTADPALRGSIAMISAVRRSLIEDFEGFFLLYQPVFAKKDEKPIGAEVLLRWKNDKYGVVKSEEFLPEIEQDYAFERLGDWVIKNALHDAREFIDVNPDFKLFITVTRSQIWAPYLISNVCEMAKDADFPLSSLYVQLSKECRLLELSKIVSFTQALHEKNVPFGIDDFARGNAWLKTYSSIHPDHVRFSKELTDNLKNGNDDITILTYMINMTHSCGTDVYVKGIDDEETLKLLSGLPVDGYQGAIFSEPVYYDEVLDYYDSEDTDN